MCSIRSPRLPNNENLHAQFEEEKTKFKGGKYSGTAGTRTTGMDGIQPEVLVVLLYLSLVYEIIIGMKRRGQQSFEKMRKVSVRLGKPSRGNNRMTRPQTRPTDNPNQTYRHFVQMRILARD